MDTTETIHRTVVVENAAHLDVVTVDLDITVGCSCPEPNSYVTADAR